MSFTWTSLLGTNELLSNDGKKVKPETLSEKDVVGLYFSAHWCPPCRGFTPVLAKHYEEAMTAKNKDTSFEIVFVSSDRDQGSFDEYRAEMPWIALDFAAAETADVKQALSTKYGVRGIPMLVFLNGKTGEVLSTEGRSIVSAHGSDFPARAKNAAKEKIAAMKKIKDLSAFDVADASSKRDADYIVVAFGSVTNRGWDQFVKPKLKETCAALKKDGTRKVDVLFVPMDAVPGTAVPDEAFETLPVKHNISVFNAALGGVDAPHVLVVNGRTGEIVVEDAARECYETGFDGFPWDKDGMERFQKKKAERLKDLRKGVRDLKCFENVKIFDGEGREVSVKSVRDNADVVGLYFSAHWCGPCRGFTPQLAAQYDVLRKAGKKIEIIFVSSDQDQASFDAYFKEMPWKALDYSARDLKETLSEIFEVSGIPTLVLLQPNGDVISTNGRSRIMSGVDAFPYDDKAMDALAQKKLLKEAANAKSQEASGKVVFKRHRGNPGASVLDIQTNTVEFKAFDTFAADPARHAVKSGKYFYEINAVNVSQGICQVGWVDAKFKAIDTSTGEGVGDDKHGWGVDPHRQVKWHGDSSAFGASWKNGDVLGCAIDLDTKTVSFGLNGKWDNSWGVAFSNIVVDADGVVPAMTAQGMGYKLQYNFGKSPFKFGPPEKSYKAFSS